MPCGGRVASCAMHPTPYELFSTATVSVHCLLMPNASSDDMHGQETWPAVDVFASKASQALLLAVHSATAWAVASNMSRAGEEASSGRERETIN